MHNILYMKPVNLLPSVWWSWQSFQSVTIVDRTYTTDCPSLRIQSRNLRTTCIRYWKIFLICRCNFICIAMPGGVDPLSENLSWFHKCPLHKAEFEHLCYINASSNTCITQSLRGKGKHTALLSTNKQGQPAHLVLYCWLFDLKFISAPWYSKSWQYTCTLLNSKQDKLLIQHDKVSTYIIYK